jgi:hypothetical protein
MRYDIDGDVSCLEVQQLLKGISENSGQSGSSVHIPVKTGVLLPRQIL